MATVAFIGLGAMGAPMAWNLHGAGFPLRVWSRDRTRMKPFAGKGIHAGESPAEVATGAAFVISMVADDVATREVMLGKAGVLSAAAPGTIVVDCSTNTPGMAREVARAAASRGVAYLDAPVLGSLPQAENRELVVMVGGDRAAFDGARPIFEAMARMARHVGESGAGATIKLINNMLSGTVVAALAEAVHVAEAAEVDPAAALEILAQGAAGCRAVTTKLPMMFERNFKPQFQLELMDKDLRYFLQLAAELDRPAPIASLVRSQYQ